MCLSASRSSDKKSLKEPSKFISGIKANLICDDAKKSISNSHAKPIYEDVKRTDDERSVNSTPTKCYDSMINEILNDIY